MEKAAHTHSTRGRSWKSLRMFNLSPHTNTNASNNTSLHTHTHPGDSSYPIHAVDGTYNLVAEFLNACIKLVRRYTNRKGFSRNSPWSLIIIDKSYF